MFDLFGGDSECVDCFFQKEVGVFLYLLCGEGVEVGVKVLSVCGGWL